MHRRAKLTVLGRQLLVDRILGQGWPVAVAAQAQGVSAATADKWVRRWRAEGVQGLADRSSRPQRSPRRLPPAREQAILTCRLRCRVGPHRIGWMLGEAPSTVQAVLRRQQLPRLWELDRPSGQVVRYQRQQPGELVHIDIKKQGRIPDGGGTGCVAGPVVTGTDTMGWAMTSCTSPWTTARGWPIWRSMAMSAARPQLASPAGRWPGSPGSGSPWSGS